MNNIPLKFVFFYCVNSITPDEIAKYNKKIEGTELMMISLPCSGKADLQYILKSIETGADGVIILTCPVGSCKYLEGNLRAKKRADAVNSVLAEAGMGMERIIIIRASETNNSENIISEIINYRDKIRKSLQSTKITV
jgi:coenzyme F420-reducing hydrogenase delta subunit